MPVCLCLPFAQHPDCLTHPSSLRARVEAARVAIAAGDEAVLAFLTNRDPGDETDAE